MTMPSLEIISQLPVLQPRRADGNKGDFGRVLVVAGSRGMAGAGVLCAGAALRGGAGLVRLAVPAELLPVVAAANPCYLTAPLPQDEQGLLAESAGKQLLELVPANDVIAFGPGLGRSLAIASLLLEILEQTQTPIVIDADGLNALAGHLNLLQAKQCGTVALRTTGTPALSNAVTLARFRRLTPSPTILTPHPGEFARLVGRNTTDVQKQRQELAVRFAADHGVVLVLKGHGTIVTDGRRVYQNTTGNPGMATGGTGDVLTGLIAALIGQGLEAFAAAQLGVHLHGLAGDLARNELGEVSLIASDLLHYLSRAFRVRLG